ncbi:MAG: DUF952 domain-containing protein [Capsulimonadales bacterium]|nr:DUF952 domain-containing protein [Capsulimonadales bacterium]
MLLLHIVDRSAWERAAVTGEYRADSLETEGFVHLSTPEQVLLPANRFYRGRTGLVLLVIDSARLTAPLRFEAVPGHGTFPHLFGPLNTNAVLSILTFEPDENGTFFLPEALRDATN